MIARKKKKLIIISSIVVVLLITIGILIYLYLTTDLFKSNDFLFAKYIGQDIDIVNNMFNRDYMKEANEIIQNNKYTSSIEAKINYEQNEETQYAINNLKLIIDSQIDKNSNYDYKNIQITNNDEKLLKTEYIEDNNNIGIRLDGIKQFVTVRKDNDENNLDNIIANIENIKNLNINEIVTLTPEEKQVLQDRYLNIISQEISKEKYGKKSGVIININNEQVKANSYYLKTTKEQFNNLYIKILEQIKQDDIVLSKIRQLDEIVNHFDQDEFGRTTYESQFKNNIESKIVEIKNSNIGEDERIITVYERNGKTIRTQIQTEEENMTLDFIENEGNVVVELNNEKVTEKENGTNIRLEKQYKTNEENVNLAVKEIKQGVVTKLEINTQTKMENNNLNMVVQAKMENNNNILALDITNKCKVVNNFSNEMKLNEENNIEYNNLEEIQKNIISQKLQTIISEQILKINDIVKIEDIENMLVNVNAMEKKISAITDEGNVTEADKNRFNTKFEFFVGENMKKEDIIKLIDTAKGDLDSIKITAYKENLSTKEEKEPREYKIIIKKNNKNEELAEKFAKYMKEEQKDNKFTVKIEYNEETKLVENIIVTVQEEQK